MHPTSASDLDKVAEDLLWSYADEGVVALVVSVRGDQVFVRCQNSDHVEPLLRQVLKQYQGAPEGVSLN